MYKRFELHNHTRESDGSFSVKELIDRMVSEGVDAFALTDHNTVSGHRKAREISEKEKPPLECIYGMEYTTYYGHILCFNFHTYIPWENIDSGMADKLFASIKKTGALAGIAHPFSFGAPVAQGCRWEMRFKDYSSADFIEVINNSESLEANEQALCLWERLCLKGVRISMTAGMDFHGKENFDGCFTVYIKTKAGESAAASLRRALKTQKTCITKGPVFEAHIRDSAAVQCRIIDCVKKGFSVESVPFWTIKYTSPSGDIVQKIKTDIKTAFLPLNEVPDSSVIIAKLYAGSTCTENLVAVAPAIYR